MEVRDCMAGRPNAKPGHCVRYPPRQILVGLLDAVTFEERPELLLQLAELHHQFGQLAEGGLLAKRLPVRQGGSARVNALGGEVLDDTGPSGDHRTIADRHVVANGGRTAEDDARCPRLWNRR